MTALTAAVRWARNGWEVRNPSSLYASAMSFKNAVGTVWIFGLMLLIVTDVLGRWLFSTPVRGVPMMVSHSIVGIIFLQLASTLEAGRITRSSVFIGKLLKGNPFAAHIYQFLFHALGVVVLGAIAWGTYPLLASAWATGEFVGNESDVSFVIWPLKAVIVLGAGATAIQFGILAARDLRVLVSGDPLDPAAPRAEPRGWTSLIPLGLGIIAVVGLGVFAGNLSRIEIGLVSVAAMLFLVYSGMHIAIALVLLSFGGMWMMLGTADFPMKFLAQTSNVAVAEYIFGVVPLFVLTGLLVNGAQFGREAFEVAEWIFGRMKGGLGIATVAANAVFAAITGVSLASAAVFTRVAVPPMEEAGYTPKFAVGIVAGSSVLGMLIPPSLLLIIFGIIAEVSVGKLFLAAIVPGLILATVFSIAIVLLTIFAPRFVGTETEEEKAARLQGQDEHYMNVRLAATKMLPILILMVIVLGGIYGGVFSPTEAGAAGAFGALVIALAKRRLTWRMFWDIMLQTGHISTGVLFLIIASKFYAKMLTFSGVPFEVMGFVTGADLGLTGVVVGYMVVLLILGMILDPISILLITLPMVLPIVSSMGGDLIWFGIITIIATEAGLLTPPLGLTVFVVQGILGDDKVSVTDVFKGSFPFVVSMVLVLILLISVPWLSLVFL